MKEAFEKIIERLEEELHLADKEKERCARENQLQFDSAKGYANGIAVAIEIVNQVAEEYATDINVGSNDGWIPCSDRLPENRQIVLVTFVEHNELVVDTVKYLNGEWEEPNYCDWTLDEKDVLAWQPLPAPYKPKGE